MTGNEEAEAELLLLEVAGEGSPNKGVSAAIAGGAEVAEEDEELSSSCQIMM